MDHFDQSRRRFFRNTVTGTSILVITPVSILETSTALVGDIGIAPDPRFDNPLAV
ncbi:MAG: hypothetical protein JWP57_1822, partial [Spirosoma sp.]|nr:hypothetical protein [Spirosoma sp.]